MVTAVAGNSEVRASQDAYAVRGEVISKSLIVKTKLQAEPCKSHVTIDVGPGPLTLCQCKNGGSTIAVLFSEVLLPTNGKAGHAGARAEQMQDLEDFQFEVHACKIRESITLGDKFKVTIIYVCISSISLDETSHQEQAGAGVCFVYVWSHLSDKIMIWHYLTPSMSTKYRVVRTPVFIMSWFYYTCHLSQTYLVRFRGS